MRVVIHSPSKTGARHAIVTLLSWILVLTGGYLAYRGASDYYQSVDSQQEQALAWENQTGQTEQSLSQEADAHEAGTKVHSQRLARN